MCLFLTVWKLEPLAVSKTWDLKKFQIKKLGKKLTSFSRVGLFTEKFPFET